jgi:hypothetical protein
MADWKDIEAQAPELAALARTYFDAFTHKTIATLRKDGSPRISGTEVEFRDGQVWIGSMWQALKAKDLQRDPRYALHSGSASSPDWTGDAKIAGTAYEHPNAEELRDEKTPPGPFHAFRLDITELSVVRLDEGPPMGIIVTSWKPGRGVTELRRT